MKPTRLTQPYRQGARQPGPALDAMLKGRTAQGYNPKDLERAAMLTNTGRGRSTRPSRPQRPARPARPPQ